MSAPAVILAVKAAALAATDHRARTAVASVIAAVLLPFILVIVMVLSLLDGTSTHNISAIDSAFHGGAISAQTPDEYRIYLEEIRQSFSALESIMGGIDYIEDGENDGERIKSIFYSMFFGETQPSKRAQEDFVDCFVEYEERTDGDGNTYMAAIPITDMETVYGKIQSQLGQTISTEQRANAQRIYGVAAYGLAMPGGMTAGAAMGDGRRCFRRQPSILAIRTGGEAPRRRPPLTAADTSAGSLPSLVFTICQGYPHRGFFHSVP